MKNSIKWKDQVKFDQVIIPPLDSIQIAVYDIFFISFMIFYFIIVRWYYYAFYYFKIFNRCSSRSERKSITAPELKTENENRENLDQKSFLHYLFLIVEKQNYFLNYLNYWILIKTIFKYTYFIQIYVFCLNIRILFKYTYFI